LEEEEEEEEEDRPFPQNEQTAQIGGLGTWIGNAPNN
jgi:hypothetical protein